MQGIRRLFTSMSASSFNPARPLFSMMHAKFTKEFAPQVLDIIDESTLHAEHEAMRDNGFNETHFKVLIVSDAFKGKLPVQRHRMVYALLDEEFKQGLHAINIVTKTSSEYAKETDAKDF